MYISIKLPQTFGSFNQLRKENYPFNNLFTAYLAAVSRLGMKLKMDVDELVGYIEDNVFDGQRLPDVPEGNEPVNIRYKTEDPDVVKYIGESSLTNRMAVMYIARMTLRLSAAYGTSLFRLTRLINDLEPQEAKKSKKTAVQEPAHKETVPTPKPKKMAAVEKHPIVEEQPDEEEETESMPMPKITKKVTAVTEPAAEVKVPQSSSVSESAQAALDALSELDELTAKAKEQEIVETSPYLNNFM